MRALLRRARADLGLLALPLVVIASFTYLSFLVTLVLLSASSQVLRSGAYSSSPPPDVYTLKTVLLAGDLEQTSRDETARLLAEYLESNPKVQLQVPLTLATSNSSKKYLFQEPAYKGVMVFSATDLKNSSDGALLELPAPGSLALAGNVECQIPELTNDRLGKIPIESRVEPKQLLIRGDNGWVADYSDSGVLLASPALMQDLAFPFTTLLSQGRLLCLCSMQEAEDAAESFTEYMRAGGFQTLALAQDPVAALPVDGQIEAASELLLGIYPLGILLATGSIVTIFIGRINAMRSAAFAVERINGAGFFQQLLRINAMVFLSISFPLYGALKGWEFLTYFDVVDSRLPVSLLVLGIVYSHTCASLGLISRYRKLGY